MLIICAVKGWAQDRPVLHHYTNENGLPANGVKGIEIEKKNGFVWIGTQAGLVRFDGKFFLEFPSSKKSEPLSRITWINRDQECTIYAEDENFNIFRVSGNTLETIGKDSFNLMPSMLRGGSKDPSRLVAGILEKIKHPSSGSFLPFKIAFPDPRKPAASFLLVYLGRVWQYDEQSGKLAMIEGFSDIVQTGNTTWLVNDQLEISGFDGKSNTPGKLKMPAGMPWNGRDEEKPQLIWAQGMTSPVLSYKKGIWILQQQGDSLYYRSICKDCVPENAIISSAQLWPEQGLILLGSEVNGLYMIRTPFVLPVRTDSSKETGKVEYAQVEVAPNIINTASGLSYSAEGRLLPQQLLVKFPHSNVFKDGLNNYWYSWRDTIFHYYSKSGNIATIPLRDSSSRIIFAQTRKGGLYVISDMAIAQIVDDRPRQVYKIPGYSSGIKNTLDPTAVVEWQPGILAIAAQQLVLFNTSKEQVLDSIQIPDLGTKVRSLWKHGDYLFIGTYGQGFYVLRNGVVKKMPLDKSGYLSHVHCFMEDSHGYCWISTNHGLFKASVQALLSAFENDLKEIYYHHFGRDDGMYNTEMNGGCQPCALSLGNGLFSFPTMNGVVLIDPAKEHAPPPSGKIFVDEIWVDTVLHKMSTANGSIFPYETKSFRFKLAMPQYGNKENVYFSYRLEPYSDEWESQELVQNNTILFGRLQPGHYKLYLRVRNGFEPDQFGMTIIGFSVATPWFQTWWYYLLCAGVMLAFIWLMVKWRTARITKRRLELQELVDIQTRSIESQSKQLEDQLQQLQQQQARLEKNNNIQARLIGIISHDMISPLKFMGYMSKKLQDVFPAENANHHTAAFIANVAGELESLSVNILNWIKFHHESVRMRAEHFDLRDMITATTEIPATLAREKGLYFRIEDIAENTDVFHYKQAIGVIIYNLAMNAMKYTNAGGITITARYDATGLSVSVQDTGVGMPVELVNKLNSQETYIAGYSIGETSKYQFGYVIIKDLLRLTDGTVKVISDAGTGTGVHLHFNFLDPVAQHGR